MSAAQSNKISFVFRDSVEMYETSADLFLSEDLLFLLLVLLMPLQLLH